jgi:hypothetical protein
MTLLHIIAEANLSQQATVSPPAAFAIPKPIPELRSSTPIRFPCKNRGSIPFCRSREHSSDVELAVCGDFRRKR